jgi:putative hydrolase of the HAD superfamily
MKTENLKVIGFDADDTLWVNEPYYRETELEFCRLLSDYLPQEAIMKKLFEVEMANLELYGYGTKAFMLSLIETAIAISEGKVSNSTLSEIIRIGKEQIARKNEILPGVEEVLKTLSATYRLVVATKGDLLDQERKLENSGLLGYFHHIEIMSDKTEEHYRRLLHHLDIRADEFLMVGNSLKSDVLPVVNIGARAVYVPFHTTWVYEQNHGGDLNETDYIEIKSLKEILQIIH